MSGDKPLVAWCTGRELLWASASSEGLSVLLHLFLWYLNRTLLRQSLSFLN